MKKLLLLLMFVGITANAQWKQVSLVDGFGDATGATAKTLLATGKFSNSATIDSDATLRLQDQGHTLFLSILEYNNNPASFSGKWMRITVRKKDGFKLVEAKVRKIKGGYSYVGDYHYGAQQLTWNEPTKRRRKKIKKRGQIFMLDMFRSLEPGDKILIETEDQVKYLFTI